MPGGLAPSTGRSPGSVLSPHSLTTPPFPTVSTSAAQTLVHKRSPPSGLPQAPLRVACCRLWQRHLINPFVLSSFVLVSSLRPAHQPAGPHDGSPQPLTAPSPQSAVKGKPQHPRRPNSYPALQRRGFLRCRNPQPQLPAACGFC